MASTALQLAQQLCQQFPGLLAPPVEFRGEISLELLQSARVADLCRHAKQELGFDYLVDISSVDNFGEEPRFTVVYELYGYSHRRHLRLKTRVPETAAELPTVTTVWRGANWHEREIFDLMGLRFAGHPDLRRILMWEGYPHFPLRKDFPLAGLPTDLPEVAFTQSAPWEGGPFVTTTGQAHATEREPRRRPIEPIP